MTAGIQPDPVQPLPQAAKPITLGQLERVRLILRGGSVVDWYRLGLQSNAEVRDFLAVNGYDADDPDDETRLRNLFARAAEYLDEDLDLLVPEHLWSPERVEDPFIVASRIGETGYRAEEQRVACILLKVVHTINHMDARELRLSLPLSDLVAFNALERQVEDTMMAMRDDGFPVAQFEASRKSRRSTITKLLSKRRASAAEILDRLRFRVIVDQLPDVAPVLAEMTRRLVPFNYVIPEETTNDLINFRQYAESLPHLRPWLPLLQFDLGLEEQLPLSAQANECSAADFRMLNFVVDLPLRVDQVIADKDWRPLHHSLGRLIFVNVEFQMFDAASWEANERSELSSHAAYKARQRDRVRARLLMGLDAAARRSS